MEIKEILKHELELIDNLGVNTEESVLGEMYKNRHQTHNISISNDNILKEILSYKCEILKMLTMIEVK
jgi:hypothetical protein